MVALLHSNTLRSVSTITMRLLGLAFVHIFWNALALLTNRRLSGITISSINCSLEHRPRRGKTCGFQPIPNSLLILLEAARRLHQSLALTTSRNSVTLKKRSALLAFLSSVNGTSLKRFLLSCISGTSTLLKPGRTRSSQMRTSPSFAQRVFLGCHWQTSKSGL